MTPDDAIRYLLSVHTIQTFDGKLDVISSAWPREDAQHFYRESWELLRRAITNQVKAPLGGIDAAWKNRISAASTVTLERDQLCALRRVILIIATAGRDCPGWAVKGCAMCPITGCHGNMAVCPMVISPSQRTTIGRDE